MNRLHPVNRSHACSFIVTMTLLLSLPADGEALGHDCASPCEKSATLVAEFLGLNPEQRQNTERLLAERHQLGAPLEQQIFVLNQQLEVLLQAGGSAEDIGHLTLEIHGRHQALASIQADFLIRFVGQLGAEQRARYASVQQAESLLPILPAFRRLRFF